ncbi:MAG TPA: FecR family protein [Polyangiaceae bacterium]
MADLHERLADSREHVRPRWTPEREREIQQRVLRAQARPRFHPARALALSVAAATVCALVWQGIRVAPHGEARIAPLARMRPVHVPLLVLEDGSAVTARASGTRLQGLRVSSGAVSVQLLQGAARFEVAPNPRRLFQVRARDATVTVLGTVFDVALRGDDLHVAVSRGRVRVEHGARQRELLAGESVTWALPSAELNPAPAPLVFPPVRPEPRHAAPRSPLKATDGRPPASSGLDWRELAARRQYQSAFERLRSQGWGSVGNDPGDLLLAADVARLSGHAADAVPLLERVAGLRGKDGRAPLAAFALGRVFLDDLGQPERAARAFRRAYELSPRGALAEDALRREVASLRKAGQHDTAELRERAYREHFPQSER